MDLAAAWEAWREGTHTAATERCAHAAAVLFWRGRRLAAAWVRWAARAAGRAQFLGSLEAAGQQLRARRLADACARWRLYAQQRSIAAVRRVTLHVL
jgi:hypothetical protein